MIATLDPAKKPRLAFGSCRTSVSHDEAGNRKHGVDAMRAYALSMAGPGHAPWPDLVLFLGDQVYADSTSDEMQEFIRSTPQHQGGTRGRTEGLRGIRPPVSVGLVGPGQPLAPLNPAQRHDLRRPRHPRRLELLAELESRTCRRPAGGTNALFQVSVRTGSISTSATSPPGNGRQIHCGNASLAHQGPGELDLTADLDEFAERVDAVPESYSWSYCRDWDEVRLIVVDSRAARKLEPGQRALLDPAELAWFDERMRGGFRHLLIGTSLPFLLPMGLHHVESWNEVLSSGKRGRPRAWLGERLRRAVDLEHWAAFQRSFQEMARLATEVADGKRGPAPQTVTFLSGDVHFSYVSEVERENGSRILQAVCSPIRNPLPRFLRYFAAALAFGPAVPFGAWMARSAHVPNPPFRWNGIKGPWFDNNLAILEDTDEGLVISWVTGVVENGNQLHPRLDTVEVATLKPREG